MRLQRRRSGALRLVPCQKVCRLHSREESCSRPERRVMSPREKCICHELETTDTQRARKELRELRALISKILVLSEKPQPYALSLAEIRDSIINRHNHLEEPEPV